MGKLLVLIVTAFLDMIGVLIVVPLLPFYATRLGASPVVYTVLVSAFSVAALVSAPFWGRFSDRYGRRPALLVALFGSAVAYVIFAFAGSLVMLFLSRIVQGAGGGTVGVIQAYVSDATEPKNRARSLGWLSAATNLGVTIGPLLGALALHAGRHEMSFLGYRTTLGERAPGLLAAALCLVNMLFAYIYLRESRVVSGSAADRPKVRGRSIATVLSVVEHPNTPASRLIWIYAIGIGAFMGMNSILALYLAKEFGVTADNIAYFFTYTGAISVLTRALFLGPMVDRYGEARLSRIGIVLLASGLALTPLARTIPFLAFTVALIPLGTAFTFPCVTALLSRVISSHDRGLYMGTQQTWGGIMRVIFPPIAGLAFQGLGPRSPFWISAACVVATLFLGAGMERFASDAETARAA
ncbi:MAG TPA: MFS transporter [Gemmatimonadaceae bacterium]|nr:MFS transporter [Gemmatimonadaceae bacterium]